MFGADLAARIRTVQQLGDLTPSHAAVCGGTAKASGGKLLAGGMLPQRCRHFSEGWRFVEAAKCNQKSGTSQRLLVVCLSEHGFVGALNETLVSKVVHVMAEAPSQLFVLGKRGLRHVEERGLSAHEQRACQRRLFGLRTASDLVERLFDRVSSGEVARSEVVFAGCAVR